MNHKVLFVDDDPEILFSFERNLTDHFDIFTESNGIRALETVRNEGPFAVIFADMHMPAMDGVQLLTQMEAIHPQTVRIMLTGRADLQVAMDAVNNGHIFRFLTKPCAQETIINSIEAGIHQYHLETAERELLEQTMGGSINVVVEILRLSHPALVSRTNRAKKIAQHIIAQMELLNGWQYELALTLSQIGYLAFQDYRIEDIYSQELSPEGKRIFIEQSKIGSQIIKNIPRLENIAAIIGDQCKPFFDYSDRHKTKQQNFIELGAQILRVSLDLDTQYMNGHSVTGALKELKNRQGIYNPELLKILESFTPAPGDWSRIIIGVPQLKPGMIVDEDILRKDGTLLLGKNEEISPLTLKHLQRLHDDNLLREPFYVLVR